MRAHARTAPARGSDRILMVVYAEYTYDPRVRREAEALRDAGYDVDVISAKESSGGRRTQLNGVTVYHIPVAKARRGKLGYVVSYSALMLFAFAATLLLYIRRRYVAVHVHNMPDFLVFVALVPRLFGARVVLDLHDPSPEVFMAKYSTTLDSRFIRLLVGIERYAIAFADAVITPNTAFKEVFVGRGAPPEKISIVMNSPQETLFHAETKSAAMIAQTKVKTLMYHGTIVERHGLDDALRALASLCTEFPDLRMKVFGSGDFVGKFLRLRDRLQLAHRVEYLGQRRIEEIAHEIPSAEIGIIPNKLGAFTNLNFPTRIFEYASACVPVVAPRTRGVLDYCDEESAFLFEPGDWMSLRAALRTAVVEAQERARRALRCHSVYREHTWALERRTLTLIYDRLLRRRAKPGLVEPRGEQEVTTR